MINRSRKGAADAVDTLAGSVDHLRWWSVAVVLVLALSGCTGGAPQDSGVPASPTVTVDPQVLPAGKAELPLSGLYFSPRDFVPALRLTVPDGWTSTHRGDDAFDLSRPDPAKDAPEVVVAVLTPPEATAAEALTTLRARLGDATSATGSVGGLPAEGLDVVDGTGPLLESPAGTLSLDRAAGQRARLLALDIDDTPLLVAVVVPDGSRFDDLLPDVSKLLAGIRQD